MSVQSKNLGKALLWAAIIISVALFMSAMDVSNGVSFGVIGGLTGAAWGSLQTEAACTKGCLQ